MTPRKKTPDAPPGEDWMKELGDDKSLKQLAVEITVRMVVDVTDYSSVHEVLETCNGYGYAVITHLDMATEV